MTKLTFEGENGTLSTLTKGACEEQAHFNTRFCERVNSYKGECKRVKVMSESFGVVTHETISYE